MKDLEPVFGPEITHHDSVIVWQLWGRRSRWPNVSWCLVPVR